MNLTNLLKLLPVVGPVLARGHEFVDWFLEASALLDPADQDTAKAALADIQAENDAGHKRYQEKLLAAMGRA
ncbi:hypothetical protein [Novosphingobium sp.]|uniref:hypothetical protein n=1 Tax=Novosphingobium sp. TaxID=1874826 RepID=UPI00286E60FB|nr:hypothetical protein [Novosphingobium sp.]